MLINSILSLKFRKRIAQIERFIKNPYDTQMMTLLSLLRKAKNTYLGKKYDFKSIRSYNEFSKILAINEYEKISDLILRARKGEQNLFWKGKIKWFAKSSGTTNDRSKFIPITNQSIRQTHYRGGKDAMAIHYHNNPKANIFDGKILRLGGSKDIYKNDVSNSYYGDLSAVLISNTPSWVDYKCVPNKSISLDDDWENKLNSMANACIKEDVRCILGVPSWMLLLMNKVLEISKKNSISEVWNNISLYMHGGINFEPYREQYKKIMSNDGIKYMNIYNASEGFFAIQDTTKSADMLLMLDYGIFYEFIDMEKINFKNLKAIPLWEVELNKNYAILITTNCGLWRYLIGDTVKFTSIKPFRIQITGRTKHYINAFGEELIVDNSDRAVNKASIVSNAEIVDYTVAPIYMQDDNSGSHEWMIEFSKKPYDMKLFKEVLDKTLRELNSDYDAKRTNDSPLKFPKINIAKQNLFYKWMKNRGKLGGQNKVPRLSNDRKYIDELLELNEA